ncbi:MAG: hypothetical protein IKQ10_07815 [Oscillospiraceae bacterium]|nr:hypothetical protein [Oscillospiraceae bacterium]
MKETATHSENSQDQGIKAWWRKNWKKVVAGVVVVGGTILVIKNWDEIVAVAEKLAATLKPEAKVPTPVAVPNVVEEIDMTPVAELAKEVVRKSPEAPFDVIAHIRTLPEGWHASPEKIAEAAELQIVLLPNQTLVDAYTKGIKVA